MDINTYAKNLPPAAEHPPGADALQAANAAAGKAALLAAGNTQAAGRQAAANHPALAPLPQTALFTETLQMYGYKPTPENMQMLTHMLDAGIPLTKENIANMYQAFKATQNMEKALFLLQNNIQANPKNAALLNILAEGQAKITNQLASLFEGINQLQDPALKEALTKLLNNLSKPGSLPSGENVPKAQEAFTKINPQAMPKTTIGVASANAAVTQKSSGGQPLPALNVHIPTVPKQAVPAAVPFAAQTQAAPGTEAAMRAYSTFEALPAQAKAPASESSQPPQVKATVPESLPPALAKAVALELSPQAKPAVTEPAAQPPAEVLQAQVAGKAMLPAATAASPAAETPASPNLYASSLPSYWSLPLQGSTTADIENFINNLRAVLEQAQAQLAGANQNNPGIARVLKDIQTLTEYIDFTSQLKNQAFVQIPLNINDQIFNTAMYVNKDGKAGQKNKKNTGSALVALDTAFLGHFETYVQKDGAAVHCQFRLENEEIENLVRANIHLLDNQLKEHKYILESFTFLVGDRPFTLLDALKEQKSLIRSDTVFDAMA